MKHIGRILLFVLLAVCLALGATMIVSGASDATTSDSGYTHRGNNIYDGSGYAEHHMTHQWTTGTMPVFAVKKLVYGDHFFNISDQNFAWASQDLALAVEGHAGISYLGSYALLNNYGYVSCSDSGIWIGSSDYSSTSAGTYVFGRSGISSHNNADYGSRYLITTVFELESGQEYCFTPVISRGEGVQVLTDVFMSIQGYSDTNDTLSVAPYHQAYTYAQIDGITQWFNYNGQSTGGEAVGHSYVSWYTDNGKSGNIWVYNSSTRTKYITILLRCANASTVSGYGMDYALGNSQIPGGGISDSTQGLDLGRYSYWRPYICYSPFTYTFYNNGAVCSLQRSGVSVVSVPSEATKENKTGYHQTGYLTLKDGTVNGSARWPVNGGSTSSWNGFLGNACFYQSLFGNAVFEAEYEANTYAVSYQANGGTGSCAQTSHTYDKTGSLSTGSGLSRTGYRLIGWAGSAGHAAAGTVDYALGASVKNLTTMQQGTVTLYAVWKYLGEAPSLRYQNANMTTGMKLGWFNEASTVSRLNKGMLTAYDPDGDLTDLKLYAGSRRELLTAGAAVGKTTAAGSYLASVSYDFRKTDTVNLSAEGMKEYTLVASDACGHETSVRFYVMLDFTPPVLTEGVVTAGSAQDGDNGIAVLSENILLVQQAGVKEAASDALSGVAVMKVYTFEDQGTPIAVYTKAPWAYEADLTEAVARSETSETTGLVIRAWDQAGNEVSKLLLFAESLRIRLVPYLPSG